MAESLRERKRAYCVALRCMSSYQLRRPRAPATAGTGPGFTTRHMCAGWLAVWLVGYPAPWSITTK